MQGIVLTVSPSKTSAELGPPKNGEKRPPTKSPTALTPSTWRVERVEGEIVFFQCKYF